MTRIPPREPPYEPTTAEDLARLMPPGMAPLRLFTTLAHNPRVLHRVRKGGLLDPGSIALREREIVILRTCALCDALHRTASVPDELWRPLAEAYRPDQLVELLALAGQYHMISYVTNALAIELEPDAPRFPTG